VAAAAAGAGAAAASAPAAPLLLRALRKLLERQYTRSTAGNMYIALRSLAKQHVDEDTHVDDVPLRTLLPGLSTLPSLWSASGVSDLSAYRLVGQGGGVGGGGAGVRRASAVSRGQAGEPAPCCSHAGDIRTVPIPHTHTPALHCRTRPALLQL
jgi:hypothetical protein